MGVPAGIQIRNDRGLDQSGDRMERRGWMQELLRGRIDGFGFQQMRDSKEEVGTEITLWLWAWSLNRRELT